MNLQQLEYILAVDQEKHFVRAATKCFVTQATLSMMIKKLEEELDIKIFDRSSVPVSATEDGRKIIEQAKKIVSEIGLLKDYARELKGEITGELRLGIIPTLAPYLLPLFLKSFSQKHPHLKIIIRELTTEDIVSHIRQGDLHIGLLATPLNESLIAEHPLFYEEFFAYASKSEKLPGKKYLLPSHINPHHLWLLEEGHCMRNQLMNLCSLKKQDESTSLHYEAGSIETLINLVDKDDGVTILPQLATLKLSSAQRSKLREFAPPKPVREVSLVTNRHFPRKRLLHNLKEEIQSAVRKNVVTQSKGLRIVDIEP